MGIIASCVLIVLTYLLAPIVVSGDRDSLERLVAALGAKLFRHDGGDVEAGVAPQVPRSRLPDEEAVEGEHVEAELFQNVLWRRQIKSIGISQISTTLSVSAGQQFHFVDFDFRNSAPVLNLPGLQLPKKISEQPNKNQPNVVADLT